MTPSDWSSESDTQEKTNLSAGLCVTAPLPADHRTVCSDVNTRTVHHVWRRHSRVSLASVEHRFGSPLTQAFSFAPDQSHLCLGIGPPECRKSLLHSALATSENSRYYTAVSAAPFSIEYMKALFVRADSFRCTCLGTQVDADARNSVCHCLRRIAGGAE